MMGDLCAGKADCVIVKDFSRLGRDYIGTGRLIQRVFPAMGVRFIALTDQYDSLTADERENTFLVPVKNLINDAYCRDISQKVRSRQRLKREQGQFIGAFAPYGYRRSACDRHRLAPDRDTAWVVQWIFGRRLAGASVLGISKELDQMGILAPSEYKRLKGERYATGFLMGPAARWSPGEVRRILSDEVYTGVLVQGRTEKAGYKADVRREKPRDQWARREGAHRAIVSRRDYELVLRLRGVETKRGGRENPFGGFVRCGDCGGGMIGRKSGKRRGLVCAAGNRGKGCSWNWIREEEITGILAAAVGMGLNVWSGPPAEGLRKGAVLPALGGEAGEGPLRAETEERRPWMGRKPSVCRFPPPRLGKGGIQRRFSARKGRGEQRGRASGGREAFGEWEAAAERQQKAVWREIRRCRALREEVKKDSKEGRLGPWEGRELERIYRDREEAFREISRGQERMRERGKTVEMGRLRAFLLAFVREALIFREKRILVRLDFADPFQRLLRDEEKEGADGRGADL